jgi:hypothetical protein
MTAATPNEDLSSTNLTDRDAEAQRAHDFVAAILDVAPTRRPTSEDERRAHDVAANAFRELGLAVTEVPFEFNENLYATLALHFGVATLGSAVAKRAPLLGLALHALAAGSYTMESVKKGYLLRRLFPFKPSQNVLATLPAKGERRLRVVLVAHIDTAFTGWLFDPRFVKHAASTSGPLHKSLRVATGATALLALIDALALAGARGPAIDWARRILSIPALAAFVLNLQVTLRDEVVPGASDNLSGVAGGLLLAQRFLANQPDGVELVFVTSGCEEAGLGGAQALVESKRGEWSTSDTVAIAIDGLSGGALHTFGEGEIFPIHRAPWLQKVIDELRANDARFADVTPFEIPVGGTDFVPFARAGYAGLGIGRVDPKLHMPRNYHHPADTLENMDPQEIVASVDFVESLIRAIAADRLRTA